MDKKFLITLSDGIYRFFAEDNAEYTVSLRGFFEERVLYAIEEEEESSHYTYEITDIEQRVEVFDLSSEEAQDDTFTIKTSDYVYSIDPTSFITANGEKIDGIFSTSEEPKQVRVVISSPPDSFRVQLYYYSVSTDPLLKDVSYSVEIVNNSTGNSWNVELICGSKNGELYLGDYDYFMGTEDSGTSEAESVTIDSSLRTKINSDVIYSKDKENEYKISLSKDSGEPQEFILYSKELIESGSEPAAYVGNLSLYESTKEDTKEPFLILSREVENEESVETEDEKKIYQSWLYVKEPGNYSITVEFYDLVDVPELVGAALVSFGTKDGDKLSNNYGIGINSGDSNLTLPPRAISLFETELKSTEKEEDKISFNYRGILGTLPTSEDMEGSVSDVYKHLAETQGIYTNNMYIGDKDQYLAFYSDLNDRTQKNLTIKANQISFLAGNQYTEMNNHFTFDGNGFTIAKDSSKAWKVKITGESVDIIDGTSGTDKLKAQYGAGADFFDDEDNKNPITSIKPRLIKIGKDDEQHVNITSIATEYFNEQRVKIAEIAQGQYGETTVDILPKSETISTTTPVEFILNVLPVQGATINIGFTVQTNTEWLSDTIILDSVDGAIAQGTLQDFKAKYVSNNTETKVVLEYSGSEGAVNKTETETIYDGENNAMLTFNPTGTISVTGSGNTITFASDVQETKILSTGIRVTYYGGRHFVFENETTTEQLDITFNYDYKYPFLTGTNASYLGTMAFPYYTFGTRDTTQYEPGDIDYGKNSPGAFSFAQGTQTNAHGDNSVALGSHTTAAYDNNVTIGQYCGESTREYPNNTFTHYEETTSRTIKITGAVAEITEVKVENDEEDQSLPSSQYSFDYDSGILTITGTTINYNAVLVSGECYNIAQGFPFRVGNGGELEGYRTAFSVDWAGRVDSFVPKKALINNEDYDCYGYKIKTDIDRYYITDKRLPTTTPETHKFITFTDEYDEEIGGIIHYRRKDNNKDVETMAFGVTRFNNEGNTVNNRIYLDINEDGERVVRLSEAAPWRDALAFGDYILSQGTSSGWAYRKWASGKVEAWYNYTGSAGTFPVWVSPLRYKDVTVSIPSGIFTASPKLFPVSRSNQFWVVHASPSSATSFTVRLATVASSSLTPSFRVYATNY